ncbi:MAG: ferredoxin [Acidobacteriota bacterium]
MAFWTDRLHDNADGEYYVDNQCIDCDVCRSISPENFSRNDDCGYSFVSKQPGSPGERALCEEAFLACPVEAIGDDGLASAEGVEIASLSSRLV